MNLGIVVVGRCQVLGHAAELVVHLLADAVGPHAGAVVEELLARSDVHQLQIRKRNADVIISTKAFRTASVNTSDHGKISNKETSVYTISFGIRPVLLFFLPVSGSQQGQKCSSSCMPDLIECKLLHASSPSAPWLYQIAMQVEKQGCPESRCSAPRLEHSKQRASAARMQILRQVRRFNQPINNQHK